MAQQPKTVEEENAIAKAKRLAILRDRARLFREVLGSPHGVLVLEFLESRFQTTTGFPPNQLDDHGRTDALQTWRKLGHHDVMQFIKQTLEWKEDHGNTSSTSI